jgi:hypothetical protein
MKGYPSEVCQSPAGLPRRALYFVRRSLCAEEGAMAAVRTTMLRRDDSRGRDGQRTYLGVQPAAEKIPVNFLLFTGKANFALLLVVPEWQPDPTGFD